MLGLYETLQNSGIAITADNSFGNPSTWEIPLTGGHQEKRCLLKMVGEGFNYFTNVVITSKDSTNQNNNWFQFALDINGVPNIYYETLEIGDIVSLGEAAIWVSLTLPAQLSTGTLTNVRIALNYIEHVI